MYKNINFKKVNLISEIILKNIPSEEQLSELHLIESLYQIRKLKACLQNKTLIVQYPVNEMNQCYSSEFDIFFDADEFIIL